MAHGRLPFRGEVVTHSGMEAAICREHIVYEPCAPMKSSIEQSNIVYADATVNDLLRRMLDRNPTARITVFDAKEHVMFCTVRLFRGMPVEQVEVSMAWDKATSTIAAAPAGGAPAQSDDADKGVAQLAAFFEKNGDRYQLVVEGHRLTVYGVEHGPHWLQAQQRLEQFEAERQPFSPRSLSAVQIQCRHCGNELKEEAGWGTGLCNPCWDKDVVIPVGQCDLLRRRWANSGVERAGWNVVDVMGRQGTVNATDVLDGESDGNSTIVSSESEAPGGSTRYHYRAGMTDAPHAV